MPTAEPARRPAQREQQGKIIIPTEREAFSALNGTLDFPTTALSQLDFNHLFRELVDVQRPFESRLNAALALRGSQRSESDLGLLFQVVKSGVCEHIWNGPATVCAADQERWWSGHLAAVAMQGDVAQSKNIMREIQSWLFPRQGHSFEPDQTLKACVMLGTPKSEEAVELLAQTILFGIRGPLIVRVGDPHNGYIGRVALESLAGSEREDAGKIAAVILMRPPEEQVRIGSGEFSWITAKDKDYLSSLLADYRPPSEHLNGVLIALAKGCEQAARTASLNLASDSIMEQFETAQATFNLALTAPSAPESAERIRIMRICNCIDEYRECTRSSRLFV